MYRICDAELRLALDDEHNMGAHHLRDLCNNAKTRIPIDDFRIFHVNQYEGLYVEQLIEYAKLHQNVMECLPAVEVELKKLSKNYISSVIYTRVGQPFKDWVDARMAERNQRIAEQQNKIVWLDPDVAAAFRNSTTISPAKGITHHLFKVSIT